MVTRDAYKLNPKNMWQYGKYFNDHLGRRMDRSANKLFHIDDSLESEVDFISILGPGTHAWDDFDIEVKRINRKVHDYTYYEDEEPIPFDEFLNQIEVGFLWNNVKLVFDVDQDINSVTTYPYIILGPSGTDAPKYRITHRGF
jgi:hypothetical protein